jgi:dihydroorotase
MKTLISGGRVIDPANGIDKPIDLLFENDKIVSVTDPGEIKADGCDKTIDASGKLVVPGLIDMHVHLREPGQDYKETIATGAAAAVAGGFTTVACMPNTDPPNDCAAVTELILKRADQAGMANVLPVGTITEGLAGEKLSEMGALIDAGVVAFSDDGRPVPDAGLMRLALEYARPFNVPLLCHCEDLSLAGGHMNEGMISTVTGLAAIPNAAEDLIVQREILLSELTGTPVHICHISTARAIEMVRVAKHRGLAVTAEATPHHFTLTEEAVRNYDTHAKMNPPLRTEDDRRAVITGLADGTIDCIATDHAPHARSEKEIEFELALNGIVGLETALPLALALVADGHLTLPQLIEKLSLNPARILRLDRGTLSEGAPADITIIDPDLQWSVDPDQFKSKGRNTPFADWEVTGRTVATIVGGKVFE